MRARRIIVGAAAAAAIACTAGAAIAAASLPNARFSSVRAYAGRTSQGRPITIRIGKGVLASVTGTAAERLIEVRATLALDCAPGSLTKPGSFDSAKPTIRHHRLALVIGGLGFFSQWSFRISARRVTGTVTASAPQHGTSGRTCRSGTVSFSAARR